MQFTFLIRPHGRGVPIHAFSATSIVSSMQALARNVLTRTQSHPMPTQGTIQHESALKLVMMEITTSICFLLELVLNVVKNVLTSLLFDTRISCIAMRGRPCSPTKPRPSNSQKVGDKYSNSRPINRQLSLINVPMSWPCSIGPPLRWTHPRGESSRRFGKGSAKVEDVVWKIRWNKAGSSPSNG